jgi:hypothetical protein
VLRSGSLPEEPPVFLSSHSSTPSSRSSPADLSFGILLSLSFLQILALRGIECELL